MSYISSNYEYHPYWFDKFIGIIKLCTINYILQLIAKMNAKDIEQDIKKFKIKQGFLWKRSRYLRQWRERWIVLTENNLYSFQHKHVYTKPTEVLDIREIQTLKSYFKQQQERDFSFRAESHTLNFYLASNTNQEKWSWISSLERIIDRKFNKISSNKQINQTINRSTFIRESFRTTYKPQNRLTNSNFNNLRNSVMRKNSTNKLTVLHMQSISIGGGQIQEPRFEKLQSIKQVNEQKNEQEIIKLIALHNQNIQKLKVSNQQVKKELEQQNEILKKRLEGINSQKPDVLEKVKETKVIETKYVQILVPQIKTVEKVVYVQKYQASNIRELEKLEVMTKLFDDILQAQINNTRAELLIIDTEGVYTTQKQPFFCQSLLYTYNRETEEQKINQILKFLILMYQRNQEYLYITDLKVLIDILIRELQLYRSQLNHFLILQLLRSLMLKQSWLKLEGYRMNDIISLVSEIQKISPSAQNQTLADQILNYA